MRAIERGVQQANLWLARVGRELGCDDREHAWRALRGTLPALRDFLPASEAVHLAAQLPMLWRGVFYEGWRAGATPARERSRGEFLAAIGRGMRFPPHPPEAMARAVFRVLEETISRGEIADLKQVLPRQVRELWTNAAG